jgi:glycosyltransferase involved in cell wall biosynthesis
MTQSKIKVIFTIHGLGIGGAEKFLVSLVNGLDPNRFDCIVISYSNFNPLVGEMNKSIEFHSFGRKNKLDFIPLRKTRDLVKTIKPDVLFSVGFFSFSLFHISTLLLKTPVKRFISYHTTIHRSSKDNMQMKFYLKFLGKNDKIIGVCQNQINYTSKTYNIPKSRLTFVYNGVDVNHWRMAHNLIEKIQVRDKLSIPQTAKVIIMTAAFRIEKNHVGAIEAFKKLRENLSEDVYLLLVGDGPLRTSVMEMVDEFNLTDKVIFTGKIEDVRPYYWSADLFALTSTGVETFSIAALEAMTCGLPGVLTNIGGANEMISDGVNGFLSTTNATDIFMKWKKCLENNFSNAEISKVTAQKFDLSSMIQKYDLKLSNRD